MENNINKIKNKEGSAHDGWEAWDAVPRDGPAVFIIDTLALDREQRLSGRWLRVDTTREAIEARLGDLLQRPIDDGWAIVDQIGLGPRMAPETMRLDELQGLREEMAAEDRLS